MSRRPPTKTLVVGHPIVAVPLTIASGIFLIAGFQSGEAFPVLMAGAVIAGVQKARAQASAYRDWQAEWEAMGDDPTPHRVTSGRVLGVLLVMLLFFVVLAMPRELAYGAGYSARWAVSQHWLLALLGLLAVAVLAQFVRYFPRRAQPAKPVAVIAKRILPVPGIADAYRALPDYCHALLRGQS